MAPRIQEILRMNCYWWYGLTKMIKRIERERVVVTKTSYLKIARPSTGTAKGIFDVLQTALQGLGISAISREECGKIVGIGTDGASVNITGAGLKGLVEKEIPWVIWMWCMAHLLELAVKMH